MAFVDPQALAPLLPIGPGDLIFPYEMNLDSTFQEPNAAGAVKITLTQLPVQAYKAVYKTSGEKWSVGFNVFTEGVDTLYQAFFWLGDPPGQGRLQSKGKFQCAGAAVTLDMQNLQPATSAVPEYPWLNVTVSPTDYHFALTVVDGQVTPNPTVTAPQIAKSTTYTNTDPVTVTYTPVVTYEYDQVAQTSVTDTNAFEAGIKVTWGGEVGWFVDKATFQVAINFKYDYTHSTTSTSADTEKYIFSEQLSIPVEPNQSVTVSLILYTDLNATANVNLDMMLTGTANGQPLPGDYLSQVVQAQGGTVLNTGASSCTYQIQGTVQANVVSDSIIQTSPGTEAMAPAGQLVRLR
jgi:hypothetical protein